MPGPDLLSPAAFLADNRNEATAVATLLLAFVVAELVDRSLAKRGKRLSAVLPGDGLSPVADTRLRLLRRLVFVTIVILGLALALSQFAAIKRVATGVLASSALLGLVVGFAARQTVANGIAGIMLAITQPIRVGDLVTFEDSTGTVEDVRLAYTYIRLGDGRRLIVPNERLAQSSIQNHTIVDARVRVEVSMWIPPGADAFKAVAVLGREPGVDAQIAEVERDGIRLAVGTWTTDPAERGAIEAGLRASSLDRLRGEGLSFEPGASRTAASTDA